MFSPSFYYHFPWELIWESKQIENGKSLELIVRFFRGCQQLPTFVWHMVQAGLTARSRMWNVPHLNLNFSNAKFARHLYNINSYLLFLILTLIIPCTLCILYPVIIINDDAILYFLTNLRITFFISHGKIIQHILK